MFKRNLMAFCTVFLTLMISILSAQDNENLASGPDSTKTLLSNLKINTLGFYVAPEIQYGQLTGAFTGFGGASAMLLLNNKFAVGVNGNRNFRNFTPTDISTTQTLRLQTQSLGLRLEYSVTNHKLIHFSFPVTLGIGNASVDSIAATRSAWGDHHFGSNSNSRLRNANITHFSYIQPGIHFDLNVFKFGKLFLGAGYRINVYNNARNTPLVNLTNAQLSGMTFQTGLKLGIFGFSIRKKSTILEQ